MGYENQVSPDQSSPEVIPKEPVSPGTEV